MQSANLPHRGPSVGVCLLILAGFFPLAAIAAPVSPPPLPPPPLPGATPGGAQPILPPPTIPIPETNLDLTVPPVYERPLGAEEGARVFVKQFVITGVIGDRKAGINPQEIQAAVDARFNELEKLVEQERQQKQNLEAQGPEGFTPEEKDKILKFMQGAVKTQSPEEQQKAYQEFIQQLMLERLQRLQGLTIGELQQIADVVTKYYHDRGFFLARAIIPAQEIKDGVVNIRVLEGRLEKVVTNNNKRYSDQLLTEPFKPLIGDLVTVDRTENALLTLSHYPGLSVAGVFRPGTDVGTTDIVINVGQEKRFGGSVTVDNSGTSFTGRRRVVGIFDWNNPTGGADLFQLTALKTFFPKNAWYGDIRYQHPIFDAFNSYAVDISRNTFDVTGGSGFSAGTFGGISKIGTLSFEHDHLRTRERNIISTFDLSRKRADTIFVGNTIARDDLAVLGYQFNYDRIDSVSNTITTSYIRLEKGFAGILGVPTDGEVENGLVKPGPSRVGANSEVGTPSFKRLTFNYQIYKSLPRNQGLQFRLAGQYSHDLLSSLEQFVIGGPDSVRALPTAQFLVDTGALGSLEYSVAAPGFADKHAFGDYTWAQVLRFKVFVDSAVGLLNDPANPATKRESVTGTGVGLEFDVPGSLTTDIRWARLNGGARPGSGAGDPTAIPDSTQLWAGITINF